MFTYRYLFLMGMVGLLYSASTCLSMEGEDTSAHTPGSSPLAKSTALSGMVLEGSSHEGGQASNLTQPQSALITSGASSATTLTVFNKQVAIPQGCSINAYEQPIEQAIIVGKKLVKTIITGTERTTLLQAASDPSALRFLKSGNSTSFIMGVSTGDESNNAVFGTERDELLPVLNETPSDVTLLSDIKPFLKPELSAQIQETNNLRIFFELLKKHEKRFAEYERVQKADDAAVAIMTQAAQEEETNKRKLKNRILVDERLFLPVLKEKYFETSSETKLKKSILVNDSFYWALKSWSTMDVFIQNAVQLGTGNSSTSTPPVVMQKEVIASFFYEAICLDQISGIRQYTLNCQNVTNNVTIGGAMYLIYKIKFKDGSVIDVDGRAVKKIIPETLMAVYTRQNYAAIPLPRGEAPTLEGETTSPVVKKAKASPPSSAGSSCAIM